MSLLVAARLEGGVPSAAAPASCQQDARAGCHHLSQRLLVLGGVPSPNDGPWRYLVQTYGASDAALPSDKKMARELTGEWQCPYQVPH